MTDLIQIQEYDFNWNQEQAVSARDLYEFLSLNKSNFAKWVEKTIKGQGEEWKDYILWWVLEYESNDIILTVDFAKGVAMMSNSKKWKEVRQYFLDTEKAYKKVIQIVKPRTTIEMLEEAVLALKTKDRELVRLETTNRQLNDTNARIFKMKAKDMKTGMKALKDDLWAEINTRIIKFYGEKHEGDHAAMHRAAWNDYFNATNIVYSGAKKASLKSKQDFLAWLNHGFVNPIITLWSTKI